MMLHYRYIILLAFIGMGFNAQAQKQKDWLLLAEQANEIGDYYGARHYYRNALEMDSTKANIQYKYAEVLRKINDYTGAERQYFKVYRKGRGRYYPEGLYWIALMNEYKGDYKKALKFWRKYKPQEDEAKKKRVAQHIKSCEFALSNRDAKADISVANAGRKINSGESEFGIAAIGDSILYYTSLRGDYNNNDILLEKSYDIQIYRSKLKRKFNRFTTGQVMGEELNAREMITANGNFNHDNSLFFFNRCDNNKSCTIMVADYKDGKFSNVRALGVEINTPNSSCTQPSLSMIEGQEYIFYSSDRPGGKGKNDIWYGKIDGTIVSEVKNMGSEVNSMDNEITPFYDTVENRLYFSSDWHEGFGGFDIFYSEGSPSELGIPQNILPPYNSPANDMYFWKNEDGTGYLTSNRIGSLSEQGETCCNDIWKFSNPQMKDTLIVETTDSLQQIKDRETANDDLESFVKHQVLPNIGAIEDLSKYLPIALYFDNDHPNPNTVRTTTKLSYSETYSSYTKLKDEYYRQADGDNNHTEGLDDFFENKLLKGKNSLEFFCQLLERELAKGRHIELAIKGYASPLSNSDYNKNLTLRRINSLINELQTWNASALLPYIQNDSATGGRLTFEKIPYGESKAATTVSDNVDNRKVSVYSAEAALERRIEILEVREGEE